MAFSWGDLSSWNWSAIVTGAAALLGSSNVRNANQEAASIATANRDTNAALYKAAGDRATGLITPILDQGNAIAAPGLNYLKTVTAQNPYTLNPQQSREVADRTLTATRSIPLSLRGSGRTSTAMINDTVNRAKDTMVGQNIARSDAAARDLTSQGMSSVRTAAPALANIATGQATNIAAENTGASNQERASVTDTAVSQNDALAAIASYFAGANKDATRGSAYDKFKEARA